MPDAGFGDLSRDVVRAAKGTVLMRQGEMGKCAYFVVEGRMLVEAEIDGLKTIVAEIGSRDLVGELAILDDAPRSATVIVAEDSLLIPLNKHRLRTIIRRSPNIAELILKLLCHKLRNTHKLIGNQIDLSRAHIWFKIIPALSLCAKAGGSPREMYDNLIEHLRAVLEMPDDQIGEVLNRLNKVHLIKLQGNEIVSINAEHTGSVVEQLKEEYLNKPVEEPSLAKEYRAIQVILQNCIPNPASAPRMDVQRDQLCSTLMRSNLWSKLHPTMQEQRAEAIVATLEDTGMIEQKPDSADLIVLDLEMLRQFPKPEKELAVYDFVRNTLLGA